MAIVATDNKYYTEIANVIRDGTGSKDKYTPAQMADAIRELIRPVVKSITTDGGTYDTASHHGSYWAAIDANGNLLLVVVGGTSTSYESIYFTVASVPTGVTLVDQSYYSYSSMTASKPYVAVFSGVTTSVDIVLNFSETNTSSDYVTCQVTITPAS